MTGLDALQSVQFITVQGKRLAVIDGSDWDALIDWLEQLEDTQTVRSALAELAAAGGDRTKAGWLKWDDVEGRRE
jgi:hypothetical protein